jgi:hypothetical protein
MLGDIERFVAELYPYRWPLTIGALILIAAVLGLAYRRCWHLVILRHKLASGLVAVALLAAAIPAGDYFLSPLWERSFLEEESPLAIAAEATEQPGIIPETPSPGVETDAEGSEQPAIIPETPSPGVGTDAEGMGAENEVDDAPEEPSQDNTASEFAPIVISTGEFTGADDFHFGRGQALLIETAPDAYTLRFENFSVRNGPDLVVYLSQDPDGYTSDALELGSLKATDGAFNYEIPPGTDVSQFKSVIVWCKPFAVLFAAAPLANASPVAVM